MVHRVERDRRRDALDAELPDLIVREEAEADLFHGVANHRPVVGHDGLEERLLAPLRSNSTACRLRCS